MKLFIVHLNSLQKLLIGVVAALIIGFMYSFYSNQILFDFVLTWDVFCFVLILLNWATFYIMDHRQIRKQAQRQDAGKIIVFILVIIACLICMLVNIKLLSKADLHLSNDFFQKVISIFCMIFSWALLHTVFTLRYAHLYYSDSEEDKEKHRGGLEFPNRKFPDFLDFAYFSFTLGMCFQVSDVSISYHKFRRIVLWHCLLSFGFNVIIVAISINIISSL